MGTVSFPRVKRPGRGLDHPPPSSAEVKERVELYIYSPSEPSWPVLGWTLPLKIFCSEDKLCNFHHLSTSSPLFDPNIPLGLGTLLEYILHLHYCLRASDTEVASAWRREIKYLFTLQPLSFYGGTATQNILFSKQGNFSKCNVLLISDLLRHRGQINMFAHRPCFSPMCLCCLIRFPTHPARVVNNHYSGQRCWHMIEPQCSPAQSVSKGFVPMNLTFPWSETLARIALPPVKLTSWREIWMS